MDFAFPPRLFRQDCSGCNSRKDLNAEIAIKHPRNINSQWRGDGWFSKVESMTNEEEVHLRAKIEALRTEVTKVPSQSSRQLDEMEIAGELDRLSSKLEEVDEAISCAVTTDPQVKSLLSSTADIWMPVITATSDERREFVASVQGGHGSGDAKRQHP